jgi:hypothetical protein
MMNASGGRQLNKGPWDSADLNAPTELVDFGSILFVPNPGIGVRADIEEATQRVVAISFDYKESVLQVQAFASSKGMSLWENVLNDIFSSLSSQEVSVAKVPGPFGLEIHADIQVGDGKNQKVRMFGVSGNRWLLRGSISGSAITDLEQRSELEDVFRGLVVDRGETPLPPREILPLELPSGSIVARSSNDR